MNEWLDDHTPQTQTTSLWDGTKYVDEQAVFEGILQKSATATAGQTLISQR